jgi:hexulose-6-phosphate isomerase
MMKSLNIWALKDHNKRPAEELFSEVAEHGFDAIELAVDMEGLVTPETDREDCARLVEQAHEAGIAVSSLASGLGWEYSLSDDDPEVRREGIDLMKRSLVLGGWLGVDTLLVIPGMVAGLDASGSEHVPYDVCYERMQDSLGQLTDTAEAVGVTIGVENVWNKVLLSPLEMRDFVDSFDSDRVGVYFDVGNVIYSGYAEDWIRILAHRISCVHVKDFKRDVGTIEGFCDLLEGDVDFPAVMEALREVGYDGPDVAEFFDLDGEEMDKLSDSMDEILAM